MTHEDWFHLVAELSGNRRAIVVHPIYIELTGTAVKAIVLQQILFWGGLKAKDEWWYKSYRQWTTETALSKDQVEGSVTFFKQQGFLETDLRQVAGHPTVHYRLSISAFTQWITEKLHNGKRRNSTMHYGETPQCIINTEMLTEMINRDDTTPLTGESEKVLTQNQNETPPARAKQQHEARRSSSVRVTRDDCDLKYGAQPYTKNLYRRERGISFKIQPKELREFERLETKEGKTTIRAALVYYLRTDGYAADNWSMEIFLKDWQLLDRSLDGASDEEAAAREIGRRGTDPAQDSISTGGGGTGIPQNSTTGLKTQKTGYCWYVDRWNELAPSARVKSADAYRHEEAFQTTELLDVWEDICRRVEDEYRNSDKNPGYWLTLEWILDKKNGRPNWRGFLARKPKMKEADAVEEALFGRKS